MIVIVMMANGIQLAMTDSEFDRLTADEYLYIIEYL
jgi:hypothetical protein